MLLHGYVYYFFKLLYNFQNIVYQPQCFLHTYFEEHFFCIGEKVSEIESESNFEHMLDNTQFLRGNHLPAFHWICRGPVLYNFACAATRILFYL